MKYLHYLGLCLAFLFVVNPTNAQYQVGQDIDGDKKDDRSGWCTSMPNAKTVAIGSIYNDSTGKEAGQVRIFAWDGSDWAKKGSTLYGDTAFDWFGYSVSMPDDQTIAVGVPQHDGNATDDGLVRIYRWDGTDWKQKGTDIIGENAGDNSGFSVSMPDVNTVAIGALYNDGTGSDAGHVRIYSWNGQAWVLKGSDIDGESAGDQSGCSVSMSDSNTLAIGARINAGTGFNAGQTRIYSWDGTSWVQKGVDLDGEAAGDQSGYAVSMPDSNTVAIGAINNDDNGNNAGHVRIYYWNKTKWSRKGQDIDGETPGDNSGRSLCMSDKNTIAIGAPYNDGNGSDAGQVRVYQWDGKNWKQKGNDIDGESQGDWSGWSVSMPRLDAIAIGAEYNKGVNGKNSGHVRVYDLGRSFSSFSASNCSSYKSPSGKTYTSSGTYVDTLTNKYGCDSLITIYLTIKKASFNQVNATSCGSYISPTYQVYKTSGTYYDTLTNAIGCDSIIITTLSIQHSTSSTLYETACDRYNAPSGKQFTQSGTYTDVIQNALGCDSIITLNITIKHSTFGSFTTTVCNSYKAPSGKTYYASNTYFDTIPNAIGCDSIITIYLTVNSTQSSIYPSTCNSSYVSPSGKVFTSSNTYFDTIPNAIGCDSIITIYLTLGTSYTSISPVACDSYTSPKGTVYKTSANFIDTLTGYFGCDSVIAVQLTVRKTSKHSLVVQSCDSYTSPSGKLYSQSVNFTDIIPNAAGCDSVISIELHIINSSQNAITVHACKSYTAPSGKVYNTSGLITDIIPNKAGCDSTITIDLTVKHPSSSSITASACGVYTAPSGALFTASGVYYDIIPNAEGCDSVITINLTVGSTYGSVYETACKAYTSPSGKIYRSSYTFTDTIPNAAGCDSIITIRLVVNNVDVSVINTNPTLVAGASNAIYQWLYVDSNYAPVPEAMSQTFTPSFNGRYAVSVTQNGCTDTSSVYSVVNVGMLSNDWENHFSVYPNPTSGNFQLDLGQSFESVQVTLRNIAGQQLIQQKFTNTNRINLTLDAPAGLYFIELQSGQQRGVVKLIKE